MVFCASQTLVALSRKGFGAAFTYDAVGSFERGCAVCTGHAQAMVQPVLDRLAASPSRVDSPAAHLVVDASCDAALEVITAAFQAAAERDIRIGDALEVLIIEAGSCRRTWLTLTPD